MWLDFPPDSVDDLLFALEETCTNPSPNESPNAIITRTTREEAGWLACAIREKLVKDRENMSEEIDRELQVRCNTSRHLTRDVRSLIFLRIYVHLGKFETSALSSSRMHRHGNDRSSSPHK